VPTQPPRVHAPRPAWTSTHGQPRIRGRKLQRLRQRLFDAHPLCVVCLAQGKYTIATIRDHIVNVAEGGADNETNTQAICESCHAQKTQTEAERGKARAR
jgi:5-methylcytosine-specific restriction protein A